MTTMTNDESEAGRDRDYDRGHDDHEPRAAAPDSWTVAMAKAHLSQVIDRARFDGPQRITRNGRLAAVVVAPEEWDRKTRRVGSLAEFFASSPLRAAPELIFERPTESPRDVEV
jgi:prevent-host-death family protein